MPLLGWWEGECPSHSVSFSMTAKGSAVLPDHPLMLEMPQLEIMGGPDSQMDQHLPQKACFPLSAPRLPLSPRKLSNLRQWWISAPRKHQKPKVNPKFRCSESFYSVVEENQKYGHNKGDTCHIPAQHDYACCWIYPGAIIWLGSFAHHLYDRVNVPYHSFSLWQFGQYLHSFIDTKY